MCDDVKPKHLGSAQATCVQGVKMEAVLQDANGICQKRSVGSAQLPVDNAHFDRQALDLGQSH